MADTAPCGPAGTCARAGAFTWYYRDTLESDGTMVQVPKKKLDELQKDIDAIKKLMK